MIRAVAEVSGGKPSQEGMQRVLVVESAMLGIGGMRAIFSGVLALSLVLIITAEPAAGRDENNKEIGGCIRYSDFERLNATARETVDRLQEVREEMERSAIRLGTNAFEDYIDALREQEEIVLESLHRIGAVSRQPSAVCSTRAAPGREPALRHRGD
jgi:hypothetical protein